MEEILCVAFGTHNLMVSEQLTVLDNYTSVAMFVMHGLYNTIDGYGNWSSEGCMVSEDYEENDTKVVCHCTHLTSFTILLVYTFIIKLMCTCMHLIHLFIHNLSTYS